jgi:putative ABC transport system ATP-binding protein
VHAIRGIDLSVEKGEFMAIMGPSGSGKTTLMNIIGCLDTPTSGTYELNGKSVSSLRDDQLAKLEIRKLDLFFNPLIY